LGDDGEILGYNFALERSAEKTLHAILSGKCNAHDVDELVRICHALAIPHVRRRVVKDSVLQENIGLNIADFAYDCIADLFATGETGDLLHFQAYFAAYPIETLNRQEIISHLRRLVFSHANQGIFRLYNEADPSLGKIIRNIKLAIQQFQRFKIIERFGELCLVPAEGDSLSHLPSLEIEDLERGLSIYLHGGENIPFMLGKLALFLQEQTDVSRVVPLSLAAKVFRSIYMSASQNITEVNHAETCLPGDDLKEAIVLAINRVRTKTTVGYARKKKIDAELIEIYLKVIEKRLNLTFSGDGKEKGLYELLKEEISDLNETKYKAIHRSRLEYLSRLTGNEAAKILEVR
jgi:hypothetical protein